ncbi:MAG: transposase [Chloroflexi bacterium]|nr:transposase [Chloroflexota bacterium]
MTTAQITSERIDDLPLLLQWLFNMHIDQIIDAVLKSPHGNRQGLSYGQLAVVFLAYILTECNHFLSPVRDWVTQHQHVLTLALGWPIRDTDFTDERLEDLLDAVGQDAVGEALEEQLGQHLIRAYALPTDTARIDTTTVAVYHHPEQTDLLDYGHSKDHRPDLRQFKEVLSTLDPVGIPLCSATVAGHCADDPLYLPIWRRMVKLIGRADFLVVGDCKLASLENRAQIQDGKGYYLAPLPMTGDTPEDLRHWVLSPPTPACAINLPDEPQPVGQGFEVAVAQTWARPPAANETTAAPAITWTERTLVVCSDKHAHRQQHALAERLRRAKQALAKRKAVPEADLAQLTSQSQALLNRYDVAAYRQVTWTVHMTETKHYLKRGRHGPKSPFELVTSTTWQVKVTQLTDAIATFNQLAGWRIYVTNAPAARLDVQTAVCCYREEWQPERGFHRLKGAALAIRPLLLRSDQRICGLLRILVIALRALTLLEFVARRQLAQQTAPLQGLYAGNPKRTTQQPTAERLLRAFDDITWYQVSDGQTTWQQVTPLSNLQRRILDLLGIPEAVYTKLAQPALASPPL